MDATFATPVSRDSWPHGLRCIECDRLLAPGDFYIERLEGFVGNTPATEIVCIPCGGGDPSNGWTRGSGPPDRR